MIIDLAVLLNNTPGPQWGSRHEEDRSGGSHFSQEKRDSDELDTLAGQGDWDSRIPAPDVCAP